MINALSSRSARTTKLATDEAPTSENQINRKGFAEGFAQGFALARAEGREEGLTEGREAGFSEGLEQGLAQARELGWAAGLVEGVRREKLALAHNALAWGIPVADVAAFTRLSVPEVEALITDPQS